MGKLLKLAGVLALVFVALIGSARPASALSISRTPPHERDAAICETRKLVDYINAAWADLNDEKPLDEAFDDYPDYFIYSDALGKVGLFSSADHPNYGEPAHEHDWIRSL